MLYPGSKTGIFHLLIMISSDLRNLAFDHSSKHEMKNILTFDLEEWFHILGLPNSASINDWDRLQQSAEVGLTKFLDLLSRCRVTCTFFVLGWVAEKRPDLIRKIHQLGHEIASHGFHHQLIYEIGPAKFREDIRRSKRYLEDLTGEQIKGYRGPGFSITRENVWAFDIISEEGFSYDATIYPGKHGHGGISGLPIEPFILRTRAGNEIEEYPSTLISLAGYRFAFAGGGYFRLFPESIITKLIRHFNRKCVPVMIYLHPRDLDPNTPRLEMPAKRRFKCYVNLSRSEEKLDKLLDKCAFTSIRDWKNSKTGDLPTAFL